MKIHVLGSGTCFPALEGQPERAHPGFFARWGEGDQHMLFDCSAGIAERLKKIGEAPNEIRNVAISHAHPDHFCLPGFQQTCLCHEMRRPGFSWDNRDAFPRLRVFAPGHIVRSIPILNAIHFEGEGEKGLPFPVLELVDMTDRRFYQLAEHVHLKSGSVYHDSGKSDALAFRLRVKDKVIAYSGDCGTGHKHFCHELGYMAHEADLFICEASARIGDHHSARSYGHLNPRQAGEHAVLARAKRLVLTHYSGLDSDEAMLAYCRTSGFEGEIIIAKDNDVYEV